MSARFEEGADVDAATAADCDQAVLVSFNPAPGVRLLEINYPPVNALGAEVTAAMSAALQPDRLTGIACVVIYGSGGNFSAGGDLKSTSPMVDTVPRFVELLRTVHHVAVPMVAAIDGHCLGGGFELAAFCDLRLATPRAGFSCSGVNVGLMSAYFRLARLLGESRASQILMTGDRFSSEEMLHFGFVAQLHEPADLLTAALELAGRLATRAPLSMRALKRGLREQGTLTYEQATERFLVESLELARSEDHFEAKAAFAERRSAVFRSK